MLKNILTNKKGISIIIVLIVAVVLFSIGGVIVTIASNNLGSANQERNEKQAYYIAKSTLQTVDGSLKQGELGQYVCSLIMNDYELNGNGGKEKNWNNIAQGIELSGKKTDNYKIEDFTITFTSMVDPSQNVSSPTVKISKMHVSVTAVYRDKESYKLGADYSFSGTASKSSGEWKWESSQWTLSNLK